MKRPIRGRACDPSTRTKTFNNLLRNSSEKVGKPSRIRRKRSVHLILTLYNARKLPHEQCMYSKIELFRFSTHDYYYTKRILFII